MDKVITKARKIKLIATDIDGVWTDSMMYYNATGVVMKSFSTYDGMGADLFGSYVATILATMVFGREIVVGESLNGMYESMPFILLPNYFDLILSFIVLPAELILALAVPALSLITVPAAPAFSLT